MSNSFDDSNWDSPLNRTSETRTAYRILKHSYAVRDQGVQVEINSGGVRFSSTNNDRNDSQIVTDHKRVCQYQEKKPLVQPVPDNRYSANERNDTWKDTTPIKPKTARPVNQTNPIHELQSKGKQFQSNYAADEDDPPFNFQAILKKTNYKRPSVEGRSIQYSSETYGGSGKVGTYGTAAAEKQDANKQYANKQTVGRAQPSAGNVKQSKDYKNELNQKLSNATRTELIPGIMIEGSSYDL